MFVVHRDLEGHRISDARERTTLFWPKRQQVYFY
jgi:hypothetical protein